MPSQPSGRCNLILKSHGQWRNPIDRTKTKNRLDYWIDLAKLLDKGRFNALFLADNFGSHDFYGGSHAPAIRAGAQWPLYDPFVVGSMEEAVSFKLPSTHRSVIDYIGHGCGDQESGIRDHIMHHI
jgi:hypothetical protein